MQATTSRAILHRVSSSSLASSSTLTLTAVKPLAIAVRTSVIGQYQPLVITPNQLELLPAHSSYRSFSTSNTAWKKGGKAAKAKPREEVEDADYANPKLDEALAKMGSKMEKTVEWAKATLYEGVERSRGRVLPSQLDSIKVSVPNQPGLTPLNQIASVTVRQGTLYVEVFDSDATKHVEAAIHKANMPGMSPQKIDATTIKIPVSRPTGDSRALLLKSLSSTIETAKTQIRLARNDGMKAAGGRSNIDNIDNAKEVQAVADKWGGELDELMSKVKKEFEKV